MQQTNTYQLNLIEGTDIFSPAPLNENMDKLEAALTAETAARQSAQAGLNSQTAQLAQRVAALEGHKIAVGHYIGNAVTQGDAQTISLGFQPQLVLIHCTRLGTAVATRDKPCHTNGVVITSGGFRAAHTTQCAMNCKGDTYLYLAVL